MEVGVERQTGKQTHSVQHARRPREHSHAHLQGRRLGPLKREWRREVCCSQGEGGHHARPPLLRFCLLLARPALVRLTF